MKLIKINPSDNVAVAIDNIASGEVIDIDGICGGYNLQLAYSTASIIAKVFKE